MPEHLRAFGRFEIESLAGAGGMGDVYRAVDSLSRGRVAIKVMRGLSAAGLARFKGEVNALAGLNHPAIVQYIAHGTAHDGAPYLVMEWLEGIDLEARFRLGTCTIAEALTILQRAAAGLAAVHALGLVHRDVKPSNLFLVGGRVEELKLLDFGLARGDRSGVTRTGVLVGTPGYMAPEQARSDESLTAAVDVFALGCVVFEALAGRPAFHGTSVMAVLAKLIFDEPPSIATARPDTPGELASLIQRMLAKAPKERPRDARALLDELAALRLDRVAERVPSAATSASRLTTLERRILSVIVIRESGTARTVADEGSDTLVVAAPTLVDRLRTAAEAVDGRFAYLADRSMVVTIGGLGAPRDRAVFAARFALSLRELVGERQIALATGVVEGAAGSGLGDAIERAVQRLAECPPVPATQPALVALDAATAAMLDDRFDVRITAVGPELSGERGSGELAGTLLGRPAPCVGRERDLHTLLEALRECVEDSLAQAVLVVAPSGTGKSRLGHEFVVHARTRWPDLQVWRAQGDPFHTDSSLGLLTGALRCALSLGGGEPVSERRTRLTAAVRALVPEAECARVTTFLGEMIGAGFPDGENPQLAAARRDATSMAEQMRQAFTDFLDAQCRGAPVMLFIEDLHWSDALSLRLIDSSLRDAGDRRFFVLALARPNVSERFPGLWGSRRLQQIRLGPLSRRAAEQLVRYTLGPDVAEATCTALIDRSEGNAFYLEELIRATADGQHTLPDTVLAMAQSRIEGLTVEMRRTLRAASIFGRVFWAGAVHALLGKLESQDSARESLALLVEREFLTRQKRSRFAGEDEFVFRHDLLREGAYSMLTEEDRRLGHRLAGAWFDQQDQVDAQALAEHAERGGQTERAAHFYLLAAESSWDNNDIDAAGPCAARGLDLGAVGEAPGALLSVMAGQLARQGLLSECEAACMEALGLLPPGSRRWVRTFHLLFPVVVRTGPRRLAQLTDLLFEVEAGPAVGAEQIHAATWICALLAVSGEVSVARGLLANMRRVFAAIEQPDLLTRAFVRAAESAYSDVVAGDAWQYMLTTHESMCCFQKAGLRGYQCIEGSFYGKALTDLGDLASAEAVLRDTVVAAERFGDPLSLAYARLFLARTLLAFQQPELLEEVAALAAAVVVSNDESLTGLALAVLAACKLRRGDLVAAEAEARTACACVWPLAGYSWEVVALHGQSLLALERVEEALGVTEEGLARLTALGMAGYGEIELYLTTVQARCAAARMAEAFALLEIGLQRLTAYATLVPPEHRARFLNSVPSNARLLSFAREWTFGERPSLAAFAPQGLL